MLNDIQGRNFEGLKVAVVPISSAQILNSGTFPFVTLVPAPGPGKMILPFIILLTFHVGGVAYTTNLQPSATLGFLTTAVQFGVNFWGSAGNQVDVEPMQSQAGAGGVPQGNVDNQPLLLKTNGGNPLAGNGTANCVVYYTIESTD